MSRASMLTAAFVLTFVAAFGQALALPLRVSACSCAPPSSLAEIAGEGGVAIFTGTVGPNAGGRFAVAVERWFFGAAPSEVVFVQSGEMPDGQGGVVVDTCSLVLTPGEQRFFVVFGPPGGAYGSSNCAPGAPLGTEEGQRLVEEAEQTFGEASVPSPAPTASPAEPPAAAAGGPTAVETGWLFLAGAVGAASLVFGAIIVVGLRRQPR